MAGLAATVALRTRAGTAEAASASGGARGIGAVAGLRSERGEPMDDGREDQEGRGRGNRGMGEWVREEGGTHDMSLLATLVARLGFRLGGAVARDVALEAAYPIRYWLAL